MEQNKWRIHLKQRLLLLCVINVFDQKNKNMQCYFSLELNSVRKLKKEKLPSYSVIDLAVWSLYFFF